MTRLVWTNDEPSGLQSTTDQSPSAEQASPGLGLRALRAGAQAPRFRLPDQYGRAVTLSALLAKGPVVLRFCRFEAMSSGLGQLDDLVTLHADIKRLGATLAVIAAQPPHPHSADEDPAAYAFPLLTDKGGRVTRSYGLIYRPPRFPATAADRDKSSIPRGGKVSAPATYVVDQECVVALAFVDLEGGSRMDSEQIVVALECLGKRRRSHSGTHDAADRREKP